MENRYYSENISKIPLPMLVQALAATMPRWIAWVLAIVVRTVDRFGKGLPPSHGVGFVGTEKVVGVDAIPAPAIARWAPLLEQLRDLGFEPIKCELAETVGTKLNCSTTLLDKLGTTTAIVEWSRMKGSAGMEEITPIELNSYRENAADIVTGIVRKIDVPMASMFEVDGVDMISLENNCPLAQRYQEHRDRCHDRQLMRLDTESALKVVHDRAQRRFAALLKTGFLRELTAEEITELRNADLTELYDF
ncbi:MAG: hypothetical protein AAGD11_02815 [Planctomycetota bacterium]